MFKKFNLLAIATVAAISTNAFAATATSNLETDLQKESYAYGVKIAANIERNIKQVADTSGALEYQYIIDGIIGSLSKQLSLTPIEVEKYYNSYNDKVNSLVDKVKDTNKHIEDDFFVQLRTQKDVKFTESGLAYKVLKSVNGGVKPTDADTVEVHYEGKLLNDEIFDSSYQRGQSATFPLNAVIPGWTEGLQLMTEGDTYEFYIPSRLAYGERGNPRIEPNSTLIFKVELIDVK